MNIGKRYSLADYQVTINIPEALGFGVTSLTIGGDGDYLSSISISTENNLYEITTDPAGNWLYNKNLARNGTIELSIQQVSDRVAQLKTLFNLFYKSQTQSEGLTITVADTEGNEVATCEDCVIANPPNQTFGESSEVQSWSLLSGKITYSVN